ncbi:MAG TPA: RagB/SusD family nutrient uptake outer membrane protein [Bacteroidales bacterium]|nr:RagB/SusD family nutrient uptake outer membrane protein [Bacteroidales bacterium]
MSITTACDPLGIEPTTRVDQDRFWLNPQLARSYVNDFYFLAPTGSGETFQSEQWSDNCQGNIEQDWDTYRQFGFNYRRYDENGGLGIAPWGSAYRNIYKINLGLEKITGSSALSENLRNQLLAETHFFRAFVYFDMIKFWGAVPYVDKALTVDDETYLPQNKREEIFDNILSDLNKSIEYFDKTDGRTIIGMVNKDVTTAFISRVGLYAANAADASAKGLFSDDPKGLFKFQKNSQHYYQIAYNAAKSLIGKYSLEEKYEDLFTSPKAHTSKESIWPVMFKENQRGGFNPTAKNGPDHLYYGGTKDKSYSWGFRSGLFPTQDLVDAYLQKDIIDGKWKKWWETTQSKIMGISVNAEGEIVGTAANYRDMFKDRDKRFYATVTYDGAYMGPAQERYMIQTWIDNSDPAKTLQYSALHTGYRYVDRMTAVPGGRGSSQTITGYYSRKYSQFNKFNNDGTLNTNQRETCYFNIRYAEVLLNCAEAAIKLGNNAEATGYINQIRNRAGLSDYDGNDLYEEMKVQRRLEFAFEAPGFRYFDLLRWGESEGKSTIDELNRGSRGLYIFRKGKESKVVGENGYPAELTDPKYFVPKIETYKITNDEYRRKFDHSRYYFAPFSLTVLKDYTQLQQNPGWSGFTVEN